jgi:hypothetical protein
MMQSAAQLRLRGRDGDRSERKRSRGSPQTNIYGKKLDLVCLMPPVQGMRSNVKVDSILARSMRFKLPDCPFRQSGAFCRVLAGCSCSSLMFVQLAAKGSHGRAEVARVLSPISANCTPCANVLHQPVTTKNSPLLLAKILLGIKLQRFHSLFSPSTVRISLATPKRTKTLSLGSVYTLPSRRAEPRIRWACPGLLDHAVGDRGHEAPKRAAVTAV